MTDALSDVDPIQVAAVLAEPTRRGLYEFVVARHEPIGRDEAAAAVGISRELAAFHLDRLVDAGLLLTEYRRLTGRTGPGAGRPAKLYRRATGDIEFSLPQRHYERAAELMATALDRLGAATGLEAVARVARERGRALGADAVERPENASAGPARVVRAVAGPAARCWLRARDRAGRRRLPPELSLRRPGPGAPRRDLRDEPGMGRGCRRGSRRLRRGRGAQPRAGPLLRHLPPRPWGPTAS